MNNQEKNAALYLPVYLSGATDAPRTRSSDGMLAGTLTVPCPVTGHRVLLQRCAFCARSDGLFLDPEHASLTLRCHLPAEQLRCPLPAEH
jgi:hypothetical protein